MTNVINHEFGKTDREHARRLAELLGLLQERDRDILANPGKYFALAGDKLHKQEVFIQSLSEALRMAWAVTFEPEPTIPTFQKLDVVKIDRRDYEALQAIKHLLQNRPS